MLLGKGKAPADALSSYSSLCMLDTAGKLLKKLARQRLPAAIKAAGGLTERQYGFRMGRSSAEALQEVVRAAKCAGRGYYYCISVCLLATLDVKNAFNFREVG